MLVCDKSPHRHFLKLITNVDNTNTLPFTKKKQCYFKCTEIQQDMWLLVDTEFCSEKSLQQLLYTPQTQWKPTHEKSKISTKNHVYWVVEVLKENRPFPFLFFL